MNLVVEIFAVLAGVVHVGAWALESVLWRRHATQRLMTGGVDDSRTLRLFAFNQGFYNLFLAAGAIGGVIAGNRSVTLFACACMAGAGLVLVGSERRLWRGALGQAVPPLVALLAAVV